ncbi:DUF930 domain-containing protein [Microvirga antarctica]|uniref:DUF930 domain-containing protein n=1 Tax=Microvirga antarctica TaxID=2819233 RepID=UPI001FECBEDD|nr:DUF930 domain-containing protein [Microvirga antarctica]
MHVDMRPAAILTAPDGPRWTRPGVVGSGMAHAALLLWLVLVWRNHTPILPPPEGTPVEIWSSQAWRAIADGSAGASDRNQQSPPDGTRTTPAPEPYPKSSKEVSRAGPIRATHILSDAVLSDPRSRQMRETLARYDAETRMEQLCGLEAMAQIAQALPEFHPQRIVAYAMADLVVAQSLLQADGAAFRSGHRWYRLSFKCQLAADAQRIAHFEFTVGDPIPAKDWEAHNLPSWRLDTDE